MPQLNNLPSCMWQPLFSVAYAGCVIASSASKYLLGPSILRVTHYGMSSWVSIRTMQIRSWCFAELGNWIGHQRWFISWGFCPMWRLRSLKSNEIYQKGGLTFMFSGIVWEFWNRDGGRRAIVWFTFAPVLGIYLVTLCHLLAFALKTGNVYQIQFAFLFVGCNCSACKPSMSYVKAVDLDSHLFWLLVCC